jgi:membrane protein YdbS with pleckstrin-like domain
MSRPFRLKTQRRILIETNQEDGVMVVAVVVIVVVVVVAVVVVAVVTAMATIIVMEIMLLLMMIRLIWLIPGMMRRLTHWHLIHDKERAILGRAVLQKRGTELSGLTQ